MCCAAPSLSYKCQYAFVLWRVHSQIKYTAAAKDDEIPSHVITYSTKNVILNKEF